MGEGEYRLVTGSDFDGFVCAMLLKERDLIADIKFVYPKDMQDRTILISDHGITTNLPSVKGGCLTAQNHVTDPDALSGARVVCNGCGGAGAFPLIGGERLADLDKPFASNVLEEHVWRITADG